ncbi:hypothetical protein ANCCAN_04522 [Ancylostoma caninum]|uniref:Uncharacterized protein n=1 Tax=Ancylostoma caninum TaxID=29170 RepID=A0A368H2F9_ANCCA|nr:hypothetical protein ANCCAN_04522 [Ancylostoma caninum]
MAAITGDFGASIIEAALSNVAMTRHAWRMSGWKAKRSAI